jgi:hypothetical protein
MSQEVRRVPADWQHPRNSEGDFIPLYDGAKFPVHVARWDKENAKWAEGFCTDFDGGWKPLTDEQRGRTFASWDGDRPDQKNYMPLWPDEQRTHLVLYETITEGTPVSPVLSTDEELARWLADNIVTGQPVSYEQWLSMVEEK